MEYCPTLKYLTFVLMGWSLKTSVAQWRCALRMLNYAPHTVTRITIGLVLRYPAFDAVHRPLKVENDVMEGVNWMKWDEVLSRFPRLECLEFAEMSAVYDFGVDMWGKPYERIGIRPAYALQLEPYIRARLPSAQEKGILRFYSS